jgi:tyrosinase
MLINGGPRLRQYVANIVSDKFALNGSYAVYLFMRDFDERVCEWALSPNLVGTHGVSANLGMKQGPGAEKKMGGGGREGIKVAGALPLTDMLLSKMKRKSWNVWMARRWGSILKGSYGGGLLL